MDDDRRPRAARRRRLLLVRGTRGRRDQERGLSHRPVRDRERDPRASSGGGGRGGRQAGRTPRADREGVRRPASGRVSAAVVDQRDRGAREAARRPPPVSARGRDRARAAEDRNGKDPALPAATSVARMIREAPGRRPAAPALHESSGLLTSRQRERERRPRPYLALEPDPAAVKLDELPA